MAALDKECVDAVLEAQEAVIRALRLMTKDRLATLESVRPAEREIVEDEVRWLEGEIDRTQRDRQTVVRLAAAQPDEYRAAMCGALVDRYRDLIDRVRSGVPRDRYERGPLVRPAYVPPAGRAPAEREADRPALTRRQLAVLRGGMERAPGAGPDS